MSGIVRFGAFEFDPERRELRKHGLRIRVPDQSLKILAALIEQPGATVTRDRLRSGLWPHGTMVGFEQSINVAVKKLREMLGDTARSPRFIERVPREGYRFIAPMERLPRVGSSVQAPCGPGAMVLHYRLVEPVGAGSMGEVWKADDTKLARTVALKFVAQRFAADTEGMEALGQEARHAAALNHPNICTIHAFEEDGTQRFLVMEYIDGTPLSAVIGYGPLPTERIVEIAIQAGEALAAAHAGGVIHRDVKPANLMLTGGGNVKLTDFGIAKAVPKRGPSSTAAGAPTPAGTLGYLSPEQARGEPADARSDLFSLGVVLYEMATGRRPFRGITPEAVLQSILCQDPVRPRTLNPGVPRGLERVILKALNKDPGARWQSAPAMSEALRRIPLRTASPFRRVAVGAATVTAVAAIAGWFWMREAPVLAERDSVVIADFENKTGDPVFDGSLRRALLTQVGQSHYLRVVSEEQIRAEIGLMGRRSGERLSRDAARELCQRIGAKAVLAGSVGMVESRYFIGLEAIGCRDGASVASEYAEAESKGRVLAALSRAASKIRGRLGESLASIRNLNVLPAATTPSLEALQAYDIALHEKSAGNDPAPLLNRAIQLDPEFAAAWFELARIRQARCQDSDAEEAITRAFALRERTSQRERLAIEGLYHQIATGDARQALAVTKLAERLYPNDSSTWRWSLLAHANLGEPDQAMEVARREVEVAPDEGMSYFDLAATFTSRGKIAEARSLLDKAESRGAGAELFAFLRYLHAILEHDSAAMEREAERARGKPIESRIRILEIQAAGFDGRLARARQIAGKSIAEGAGSGPAQVAAVGLMSAVFGSEREARALAMQAAPLDRGRRTAAQFAFSLALAREPRTAESILEELLDRYPNDTILNLVWVPAVRGAAALASNDPQKALTAADAPAHVAGYAWPSYIRGLAYLRLGLASRAAAEFSAILQRKNVLFTTAFSYGSACAYPAAQLGLARAFAMQGDAEASRKQYEEFFALWKQADPDIPILVQAKTEYVALPRDSAAGGIHRRTSAPETRVMAIGPMTNKKLSDQFHETVERAAYRLGFEGSYSLAEPIH